MSVQRRTRERICTECGATFPEEAQSCWLCRADVQRAILAPPVRTAGSEGPGTGARAEKPTIPAATPAAAASPFAGGAAGVDFHRHAAFQFHLSTLMMLVTLASVIMGVFMTVPGLGILLAVLAVPAFLVTVIKSARREARGRPMSRADKVVTFLGTIGVVIGLIALLVLAGFVALWIMCSM